MSIMQLNGSVDVSTVMVDCVIIAFIRCKDLLFVKLHTIVFMVYPELCNNGVSCITIIYFLTYFTLYW